MGSNEIWVKPKLADSLWCKDTQWLALLALSELCNTLTQWFLSAADCAFIRLREKQCFVLRSCPSLPPSVSGPPFHMKSFVLSHRCG
jgi:hypothetical protein